MSGRLRVIAVYISPFLAALGGIFFIGGLLIEIFSTHDVQTEIMSPAVQVALAGLCFGALMFLVWFTLVGWLLLRQSRKQGSGYGDAYRLIEAFHFQEAIPLLERSIHEGKETAEVLMLLTSAYAYTGQLGKAQAAADRSVRLFPNDTGSYITLANGYRLQAAYEEAANVLRQAADLEPGQPIIWAELGFAQQFAGEKAEAIQSFKHAAEFPMPAMYGVRVHYHLAKAYEASKDTKQAVSATARMMSARDGLATWQSGLNALEGTAYGHALGYEITAIQQALADADAGNLG